MSNCLVEMRLMHCILVLKICSCWTHFCSQHYWHCLRCQRPRFLLISSLLEGDFLGDRFHMTRSRELVVTTNPYPNLRSSPSPPKIVSDFHLIYMNFLKPNASNHHKHWTSETPWDFFSEITDLVRCSVELFLSNPKAPQGTAGSI